MPKVPIAQPRATEHLTTNLGGVDHPKDAGYAPLGESILSSGPSSATGSMGSYASQGKVKANTLVPKCGCASGWLMANLEVQESTRVRSECWIELIGISFSFG